MQDWQALIRKRDFPMIAKGECGGRPMVYLDNAATAQCPRPVLWALENYWQEQHANVHRGVYCRSSQATAAMEQTRQHVAEFLGAASAREIVFTQGTTDGINLLASAFGEAAVQPGDLVLSTEMEHNSNLLPWLEVCRRRGASLELVPITDAGELDREALDRLLERRPKLLAVCAVSNVLGTVNPLEEIIRCAHQAGAAVAVDAAQALRHELPPVSALDCDFLCFSGHKLMGPTGIGVLYGKAEWLERLSPARYGGGMVRSMDWPEIEYEEIPGRFEAGTPNLSGIAGLGAALEYLQAVGRRRIAAYEADLLRYAEAKLRGIPGIQVLGAPARRAGVLSMVLPPLQPYDAAVLLDKKGFALRSGRQCADLLHSRLGISGSLRLSPAFYNTREEIDALTEAFAEILAVSRRAGIPVGEARNG